MGITVGRPEGGAVATAFLFVLALFLSERLVWVAESESVIVVSGGNSLSNFSLTMEKTGQLDHLNHVVQAVDFIQVNWEDPSPRGLAGLPTKYREAWWGFESPIKGDIPRKPREAIASDPWLEYSGMNVGDRVCLGNTTLTIVGSVGAGGMTEIVSPEGNVTAVPSELYFVPSETIPRIIEDVGSKISSFSFAWHVKMKIHPPRFVDEVIRKAETLWGGFDFIRMTQTAHAAIKRAAVSSISILQVCAFLVCLLGIGMQLRPSGLLRLTLSLWTGSLLLVLALMIYNLIAPSWFVQFIPKIDLVLIGEFTALMNALLLVASKGARLVTMPGIPKPLEV